MTEKEVKKEFKPPLFKTLKIEEWAMIFLLIAYIFAVVVLPL